MTKALHDISEGDSDVLAPKFGVYELDKIAINLNSLIENSQNVKKTEIRYERELIEDSKNEYIRETLLQLQTSLNLLIKDIALLKSNSWSNYEDYDKLIQEANTKADKIKKEINHLLQTTRQMNFISEQ
ncbi:hypothetical protein [Paenibacillus sp. ACRRY]|uniref:hypothetical protein n=1 Tax=Paenibacillus sp. ACRRY TaxID=2918208 RepID=UPI001EF6DA14|nr:hypothetical protein [Paenibacillus sp. ACRRY]MCG7381737.1 hypothetical protein [Paenibacillus sp. ACRRY]